MVTPAIRIAVTSDTMIMQGSVVLFGRWNMSISIIVKGSDFMVHQKNVHLMVKSHRQGISLVFICVCIC